jgi:hypothetical protein
MFPVLTHTLVISNFAITYLEAPVLLLSLHIILVQRFQLLCLFCIMNYG